MSKFLDEQGLKVLWGLIQNRTSERKSEEDYADDFIPSNSQMCFVDTEDGIKIKIGDGATQWSELPYALDLNKINAIIENNNAQMNWGTLG